MKITLKVHGREKTFTEKELTLILEKVFPNPSTLEKRHELGKPFIVNPKTIDKKLFAIRRADAKEEWIRNFISLTIMEAEKYPEKYLIPFKTLIPEVEMNLQKIIKKEQLADWIQQGLEWAQRITNGEEWRKMCSEPDNINFRRFVKWGEDIRLIGGLSNPSTFISEPCWVDYTEVKYARPLLVEYE